jgi:hypothetical protein
MTGGESASRPSAATMGSASASMAACREKKQEWLGELAALCKGGRTAGGGKRDKHAGTNARRSLVQGEAWASYSRRAHPRAARLCRWCGRCGFAGTPSAAHPSRLQNCKRHSGQQSDRACIPDRELSTWPNLGSPHACVCGLDNVSLKAAAPILVGHCCNAILCCEMERRTREDPAKRSKNRLGSTKRHRKIIIHSHAGKQQCQLHAINQSAPCGCTRGTALCVRGPPSFFRPASVVSAS